MQPYIQTQSGGSKYFGRAICIALILHAVFIVWVIWSSPKPDPQEPPKALSIVMVALTPSIAEVEPDLKSPDLEKEDQVFPPPEDKIVPERIVEDPPPATLEPVNEPPALEADPISPSQTPVTILQNAAPALGGDRAAPQKPHIPSRWALKPPLSEPRLEGLGFSKEDIECLTSLDEHCQDLRKEVFAEYRLSETELVWTPNRPDTGMPAEFRGLSDQEIMEKLGMNYAGGNAFMLLPGIAIDGPLWDKLHGVNKTCKLRQNYGNVLDGTAGTVAPRRVCD